MAEAVLPEVPQVPGRLPLIGNMLQFRRDRLALHERAARIAPLTRMWLGPFPIDICTDAELAHAILVDEAAAFKKARGMSVFMKPLLGDGLLSAEGELHRRHRKLLAPAFAPKRIAAYGTTMVGETVHQVAGWRDGATVDVAAEMMQLTLAIAGKTLFGADVRADAQVVDAGLTLAMHALVANLTSWVRLPYGWPLPRHRRMKRAVQRLDEVVYRLIREGRVRGTDQGDVMSILLLARDDEDGTGLTDRQVRDEVMTLLLAGHETTANTLAWTWYELGRHPEVARGVEAEDQKRKYLPRLTRDLVYTAYCCSEPDAGSDVAGMRTRVTRHGDDYVLNGQKRWITNGGVANFYTVLATFDPAMKHKGIACFVVDADTPGVKAGRKENKMGQRASNTTDVLFEDVKVTKAQLVGPEDGGFRIAMKTFDRSRPWIAAGASGVIRRALDESRTYALERKTFGVPIAQHQAVQFMLAEMAIAYETTRLLTHKAAWLVDRGDLQAIVSAYAKAYGADAAMRCTTDAVQIFGGYGYTKEYPVEKLMRDAKLLQIYEGTSQIQRIVIARNLLGR